MNHLLQDIPESWFSFKVKDFWDTNGWRFDILQNYLPAEILNLLELVLLSEKENDVDSFAWSNAASGLCSVRNAYSLICSVDVTNIDQCWEQIWKLRTHERCRNFMWRVYHGNLMTNVTRAKFGGSTNSLCEICNLAAETVLHVLRDCSKASMVWQAILPHDIWDKAQRFSLKEWVASNVSETLLGDGSHDWNARCALVAWWLWK
ncbi:hypothetical protein PTKIN_Ptkin19aG0128300 [Pterospermum kingtungense]